MLYLSLPPTPPPKIATAVPQKVVTNSSKENTTGETTQSNSNPPIEKVICTQKNTPKIQPTKSDLVNNLLSKMLLAQNQEQAEKCKNNKSVAINTLAQLQKLKAAKGFAGSRNQILKSHKPELLQQWKPSLQVAKSNESTEEKSNNQQATVLNNNNTSLAQAEPEKNSDNLESKKENKENNQQASNSDLDKGIDKNPINRIIATVQEIISVSLYASINNVIQDTVNSETQTEENNNPERIAINPKESTSEENTDNQNTNSEVANANLNSDNSLNTTKIIAVVQELISVSLYAALNNSIEDAVKPEVKLETHKSGELALSPPEKKNSNNNASTLENNQKNTTESNKIAENTKTSTENINEQITTNTTNNHSSEQIAIKPALQLARVPGEPFLVGVLINGREVGTLDIIQEGNTLLVPLEALGEIAGFSVSITSRETQVKTPLGTANLKSSSLKQIGGIIYITQKALQEELKVQIELNTADLTLLTDLPWRAGSRQERLRDAELKPEVFAPGTGLSNFRQELYIDSSNGDTNLRSSTLLGGRLGRGIWRARLENNFEDQPNISEYFFYQRNGQFRYQVGRQQLGLNPLFNGIDLTGLQFGFSNLPAENFSNGVSASEILPRTYRPIQTFRGEAPPASFVQLRVGGVIIAQQQVGFNGQYEFNDVTLPTGQSNEIEVLVYDRNNLRVPSEIRRQRLNASDLLLPAGGNVQLAGLGFSGNLAQRTFFDDITTSQDGKFVGFYQFRQGLSNNLTFEGGIQSIPDAFQAQAGLVWRLANPVIISTNVGTSNDKVGYSADLDIQLERLEIRGNSQSLPQGFRTGINTTRELFNHSLEMRYAFGNRLNLGVIARSRQSEGSSANYILPIFTARPFSNLSLSGRPDIDGRYLFNAFFQASSAARLSFNSYGDTYTSDFSYQLNHNYQLSFGNEFGGNLSPRYTLSVGHNASDLRKLSWNLGLAMKDGEVAPVASASMQVLPGLLARLDYQGIPSRSRSVLGGFGDDRLTLSLISDLSFGAGRVTPTNYSGIGKERGAIAGRLAVQGGRKGFDLSNSIIRVTDSRNRNVGSARTNSNGDFFVGNLPEGVYVVEVEPEELPVELSISKTTMVAEVAASGVTKLDFPIRPEFGLAGKVTDIVGQPIPKVRVELTNKEGARVVSAVTDQFGLYRMDGVPIGQYTLRVSPQDSLNPHDNLPKRQVEISSEFVFNQNLQLPVSAASKKK